MSLILARVFQYFIGLHPFKNKRSNNNVDLGALQVWLLALVWRGFAALGCVHLPSGSGLVEVRGFWHSKGVRQTPSLQKPATAMC